MTTTTIAAEALTDLVDTARSRAQIANQQHQQAIGQQLRNIAAALDAMRTRVLQEGDAELDVAFAYVDAGRLTIAQHTVLLDALITGSVKL